MGTVAFQARGAAGAAVAPAAGRAGAGGVGWRLRRLRAPAAAAAGLRLRCDGCGGASSPRVPVPGSCGTLSVRREFGCVVRRVGRADGSWARSATASGNTARAGPSSGAVPRAAIPVQRSATVPDVTCPTGPTRPSRWRRTRRRCWPPSRVAPASERPTIELGVTRHPRRDRRCAPAESARCDPATTRVMARTGVRSVDPPTGDA